jgi:hypothetical protein
VCSFCIEEHVLMSIAKYIRISRYKSIKMYMT